ncbi:MAG: NlpC/P60 family protein [Cellvibrionaceae bacterium]
MLDLSRYDHVSWKEAEQDCWWLVRDFYGWHFGIELPRICVQSGSPLVARRALKNHSARRLFEPVSEPRFGYVVELSRDHSADHVGVYLEFSGAKFLLHNERGAGVCVTPLDEVLQDYKVKGFYKYVGTGCSL